MQSFRNRLARILVTAYVCLCAALSFAGGDRLWVQECDTVSSTPKPEMLTAYQGESINYALKATSIGRPIMLSPTNTYALWSVVSSTNALTQYVYKTGTIANYTNGAIRFNLTPAESMWPTGGYESAVFIINTNTPGTNTLILASRSKIQMRYAWSPALSNVVPTVLPNYLNSYIPTTGVDGVTIIWSNNQLKAISAIASESDPIWSAASSTVARTSITNSFATTGYVNDAVAGLATGTPVYAESDPVWVAASGSVAIAASLGATSAADRAAADLALTNSGAYLSATNVSGGYLTMADRVITLTALSISNAIAGVYSLAGHVHDYLTGAHTNLVAYVAHPGTGTASTNRTDDFATAAQGVKADRAWLEGEYYISAVQAWTLSLDSPKTLTWRSDVQMYVYAIGGVTFTLHWNGTQWELNDYDTGPQVSSTLLGAYDNFGLVESVSSNRISRVDMANHIASNGNPHAMTLANIGALTNSAAGISAAGGITNNGFQINGVPVGSGSNVMIEAGGNVLSPAIGVGAPEIAGYLPNNLAESAYVVIGGTNLFMFGGRIKTSASVYTNAITKVNISDPTNVLSFGILPFSGIPASIWINGGSWYVDGRSGAGAGSEAFVAPLYTTNWVSIGAISPYVSRGTVSRYYPLIDGTNWFFGGCTNTSSTAQTPIYYNATGSNWVHAGTVPVATLDYSLQQVGSKLFKMGSSITIQSAPINNLSSGWVSAGVLLNVGACEYCDIGSLFLGLGGNFTKLVTSPFLPHNYADSGIVYNFGNQCGVLVVTNGLSTDGVYTYGGMFNSSVYTNLIIKIPIFRK